MFDAVQGSPSVNQSRPNLGLEQLPSCGVLATFTIAFHSFPSPLFKKLHSNICFKNKKFCRMASFLIRNAFTQAFFKHLLEAFSAGSNVSNLDLTGV